MIDLMRRCAKLWLTTISRYFRKPNSDSTVEAKGFDCLWAQVTCDNIMNITISGSWQYNEQKAHQPWTRHNDAKQRSNVALLDIHASHKVRCDVVTKSIQETEDLAK